MNLRYYPQRAIPSPKEETLVKVMLFMMNRLSFMTREVNQYIQSNHSFI
jgi:hypothetical protein